MENFSLAKLKFLGYNRSFYYDKDDETSFDDYSLVDIDKETFFDILSLKINLFNLLTDEETTVFYKVLDDISLSKDLILGVFNLIVNESMSFDQVEKYLDIFFNDDLKFSIHIDDIKNFDFRNNDYFFKNENNLIVCSLKYLYDNIIEDNYLELISDQIKIIEELTDKNRAVGYSNFTTKFILYFLRTKTDYTGENESLAKFFHSSLLKIRKYDPFFSYETLAIEYFYSSDLTKKDYVKSLNYALKAFKICKSPGIANIIGKILILNCDDKDNEFTQNECFKYLVFSFIYNKNYVAGYLLADCYLYGIGTFISYEAALNILNECYQTCFKDYLLRGNLNNGYLEILSRLIKIHFYKFKGKRDEKLLKSYFLQLRELIKKRYHIDKNEYDEKILKMLSELLFNFFDEKIQRISKNNGYDITKYLNSFSLSQIEGKLQLEANYLVLELTPKENKFLYIEFKDILFAEFTKKAKFIIEFNGDNKIDEQIINEFNSSLNNVIFSNGTIFLLYKDEVVDLTNIIVSYIPSNITKCEKLYNVGCITINKNKKYLYLDDDKKEGEYIKVKNKKYQIEKILHVYEDNLPFFLDDMHQYSNK